MLMETDRLSTRLLLVGNENREELKIYNLYEALRDLDIPAKYIKGRKYKNKIVNLIAIEYGNKEKYHRCVFIFDQLTNRLIDTFIR